MEFSVQRTDLVREVALLQGVVERKTTIPVLSNILVEALEESLRVTATDLELGIRTMCPAKVKKTGATTVPAKRLLDYIRQLQDPEIKFKMAEAPAAGSLQVTCGRSHVRMAAMARDNFPVLPDCAGKLAVIPPTVLGQLINRTLFAISAEESRYTLNAALLILKPETMTMVATDGHRLAHVETAAAMAEKGYSGVSGELRILVPKKAMTELSRLLGDMPEGTNIDFYKDENHIFFRMGRRMLISRMLSGQFPNYEAVLPKSNDRIISLDQEELAGAIRRVSLFSDERSHSIRFQFGNDELKIVSSSSDAGESEETLPVSYHAPPFTIGFNWQYLLDFLAACGPGKISLEFKDEQSAGQLRPSSDDGLNYRYVVMPMRV
jgi:DNA polymerase III subunit beta